MNGIGKDNGGYELLDSGNRKKLERFGEYVLVRPSAHCVWSPALSATTWQEADAVYVRKSSYSGHWDQKRAIPASWDIVFAGMTFMIKPCASGNVGLFPEQRDNWAWLAGTIETAGRPVSVLNMFAYTGGSTLAVLRCGGRICHLDASRSINQWARYNVSASGLAENSVRWISDDADKFLSKEVRRGQNYDGIILDPPTFGRGASGEVWKIDDRLPLLLKKCRQVLSRDPLFVILSCHSPGFSAQVMANLLQEMMYDKPGSISCAEMGVPQRSSSIILPCGNYARWTSSAA